MLTISGYQDLTGQSVTNEALATAQINKARYVLEMLLGYTLDQDLTDTNEYTEIGKTTTDCPCPDVDVENLDDPDDVEYAYRLYTYNPKDQFLLIDPATTIHSVKLIKDGVTFKTLETDEFRAHYKHGFIKALEWMDTCCTCSTICTDQCYCNQLAVDATWLWGSDVEMPDDLMMVWAEMAKWGIDSKKDVRSETLGSHSYTKFDRMRPEEEDTNMSILKKYSGPNGSLHRTVTL